MNKKLADTARDILTVILIAAGVVFLVVISSQFVMKHDFIKVESTDIQYADVFCIEVLKPRPVSTLVASK